MSISIVCTSCDAKLRLRDGAAGRDVKCPHCGAAIAVPPAGQPADASDEEPPDERSRPRKSRRPEPEQPGLGLLFWLLGGFAVLVGLGGLGGTLLVFLRATADNTSSPLPAAAEQPSTPAAAGNADRKQTAFLDQRKSIPAGQEWNREIKTALGGPITFRITSQGPFSVMVVTDRAHKALLAKDKAALQKSDLLLNADSAAPEYQGSVTLPSGSCYFIIRNDTAKLVEFHLECFPPQ